MEEVVIRKLVEDSGCDAFLAFGADNFRYLTGTTLPFPDNYPEKQAAAILAIEADECVVIASPDWTHAIFEQGWKESIVTYDENEGAYPAAFVKSLTKTLKGLSLQRGKIGFDASRARAGLMEAFRIENPDVVLVPVDSKLIEARAVKTPAEVALIEQSCEFIDRGIIHALNHLEGTMWGLGYTVPEFAERIRVHIFESGGSGVGHLSVTAGENTQLFYAMNRGDIVEGMAIRSEVTAHSMGYWGDISRMAYMGYPPPEVEYAYTENQNLKDLAVSLLLPGERCDKIHARVRSEAEKMGVKLFCGGIGHGVGCSHYEAPFISEGNSTELRQGNVIALGVATLGPHNEIIVDRDIYEVTPVGARKLSWYRSWDRIYTVSGFRAVH